MKCKACVEQGQPANFGSPVRCAFESGVFSDQNWQCATACQLRELAGEGETREDQHRDGFWTRRNDTSYAALYVPPHPDQEEHEGEWRGGGFIAMTWYKSRGGTDVMVRVDGWEGGKHCAVPLTREAAEAALVNILLNRPAARAEGE